MEQDFRFIGKRLVLMFKVSVIIPIYNREKFLKKCIESVQGQTLKDIEIICIDDGSTDKSLEILNEYAQNDNENKNNITKECRPFNCA